MVNISDEERERRRQNMLALHEQGKAGAEFGKLGGRPRNPRASAKIAEKVSNEGEEIYERLMEIVRNGVDANSIKAANALLKIEEQERIIEEKEVKDLEQAKRGELLEIVTNNLRELTEAGILGGLFAGWSGEIIDAEVERVGESIGSLEETTESSRATD